MLTRRAFVGWLATTIPAAAIVRRAHALAVAHLSSAPETLGAVAQAVLPTELGAAGITVAATNFRRWMDGYRENADVLHGYGNSRLRTTGPTPATRWVRQLDELDARAQATHSKPFDQLTVDERRALIRDALATDRTAAMPGMGDGTHVALALLGHFYAGPVATDLCYEATIGKNSCRPLALSSARPAPRRA